MAWGAHTKRATHLLTGMAIGAVAIRALDGGFELLMIGGAAGLAPDIDVLFAPLCRDAHRSAWSHSLGASILFSAASLPVLHIATMVPVIESIVEISVPTSVIVVFLSAFVHAAEDAMTRRGTKLLHPFSRRWYCGPFKYDDVVVNAALCVLSLAIVLLFTGAASR
ncbi:MAG: metal-dependent hydrolase [Methanobacteriota archaeon]|nr:MAG: metal-dependent hydrolase [Euryarchaeota archaeon]